MHFSTVLPLLPLVASAAQIPIQVGNGGLKFSPNTVTASVGDQLVFSFYPKAHSVSQSSFTAPCQQLNGGFNSGLVPVSSGVGGTFTVTVNNTSPIWIYCAQTQGAHCQKGMAMVINQPSGPNTLSAYQAAAAKTSNSTIGTSVTGGVLAKNSTSSGSGSTSTASGTSSPTGSSSPISSSGSAAAVKGVAEWAVLGGAAVLGGLLV